MTFYGQADYNFEQGNLLVGDGIKPSNKPPGLDGQVLMADSAQSDGVLWSTISQVQEASLLLTSAQVKALHVTPIQLIPAQGANTMIVIYATFSRLNYGGTNPFSGGSAGIDLGYSSTIPSPQFARTAAVGSVINIANSTSANSMGQVADVPDADVYNVGVFAVNNGTAITGNAANDNTITIKCLYRVFTIL